MWEELIKRKLFVVWIFFFWGTKGRNTTLFRPSYWNVRKVDFVRFIHSGQNCTLSTGVLYHWLQCFRFKQKYLESLLLDKKLQFPGKGRVILAQRKTSSSLVFWQRLVTDAEEGVIGLRQRQVIPPRCTFPDPSDFQLMGVFSWC